MDCKDFQTALSELADGGLSLEARTRVEAHVAGCEACQARLADIRHLRQAARSLPKVPAPDHLWAQVRARLDAEMAAPKVVSIEERRRWFHPSHRTWGLMAAAAVLLLAVSSGIVLLMRGTTSAPADGGQSARVPASAQAGAPTTASANAGTANLVESVEMEIQQADQHYEKAIAGLELVAREGQGTLDTQTAAILQKNVGILDQAIRESRAALQQQPTSETARVSLFEALRRKVELLQDTVTLINEMRKGNQAGAARIVGGAK